MLFNEQTYETLIKRMLENTKENNLDTREGSVSFNLLAPLAEELAKAYISMGDILSLAFIEDTFDEYLDKRVNEFGIYRKDGEKATGQIKVTGRNNVFIENGTIVTYGDLEYVVTNDITLPNENILYVEAVDVGYRYNLSAGCEFQMKEFQYGIDSMINEEPFENGVDIETDEELKERFKYIIQNPRTSGNVNDYKAWALECDGVGKVKVYPLWNGNGTVKVLIIGNDNLPCSTDTINEVKAYIEEKRPIGATVTVVTPALVELAFDIIIKTDGDYSLDDVREQIQFTLNEYIDGLEEENVIYAKAFSAVGDLECVDDIISFKINDDVNNIIMDDYKIPIVKTVIVEKPLDSISATFIQGDAVIYTNTTLNDLKTMLTVTAKYYDNTTENITDYTLSGTLSVGTSTITVTKREKTTTFNVTVSEVTS